MLLLSDRVTVPPPVSVTSPLNRTSVVLPAEFTRKVPTLFRVPTSVVVVALFCSYAPALVRLLRVAVPVLRMTPVPLVVKVPPVSVAPLSRLRMEPVSTRKVPALLSVRWLKLGVPVTVMVDPVPTAVVPLPLIVPPDQKNGPNAVTVSEPVSVPPDMEMTEKFCADAVLKSLVPLGMTSVGSGDGPSTSWLVAPSTTIKALVESRPVTVLVSPSPINAVKLGSNNTFTSSAPPVRRILKPEFRSGTQVPLLQSGAPVELRVLMPAPNEPSELPVTVKTDPPETIPSGPFTRLSVLLLVSEARLPVMVRVPPLPTLARVFVVMVLASRLTKGATEGLVKLLPTLRMVPVEPTSIELFVNARALPAMVASAPLTWNTV